VTPLFGYSGDWLPSFGLPGPWKERMRANSREVEFDIPNVRRQMRLVEGERRESAMPGMSTPSFAEARHASVTAVSLSDRSR
jgi:hypothetical protein